MPPFVTFNLGASSASQDRVHVETRADALVVVVADGAGGIGGGAEAAEAAVSAPSRLPVDAVLATDGDAAAQWIEATDQHLARASHGGQCTLVVVVVTSDRIVGASVGDSEAWLCTDGVADVLTAMQVRKPLVGSGRAHAVSFALAAKGGRLIVATDGLFRYTSGARIVAVLEGEGMETLATRLCGLATLPSGGLQDDVAGVVVAR